MADIDFANADSRMNYLKDNLGHLMEGIDKNYGQVLMDELMRRMESTVSDFNEEVKAMLSQLQGVQTTPRDNILAASNRTAAPKASAPPEPMDFSKADDFPPIVPEPGGSVKEVEIEVDLEGESLSDFEKKLRSLGQ